MRNRSVKRAAREGRPNVPPLDDLHIVIKAATQPRQVYNGGPKGATFPGFFLEVYSNEGYERHASIQIGTEEMTAVADLLDHFGTRDTLHRWAPGRMRQLVKRCFNDVRASIQSQLQTAEAQAAKIPDLRSKLEGIDKAL